MLLESASDVRLLLVGSRLDRVSDSTEALLRWRPAELCHQSLAQLAPPGDAATLQALLVAVANGRHAEADVGYPIDTSGLLPWFSASLTALTGWQPKEWIGRPFEQLESREHRMRHRAAMGALRRDGASVIGDDYALQG